MFSASPSSIDPLPRERRTTALFGVGGAVALFLSVTWASWGLDAPRAVASAGASAASSPAADPARGGAAADAFDPDAFALELWRLKPPEPEDPAAAASAVSGRVSAPALSVDFIGVTRETDGLVAAVFDRKANRMELLRAGDEIDAYTVQRVAEDQIELAAGKHRMTLEMKRADR